MKPQYLLVLLAVLVSRSDGQATARSARAQRRNISEMRAIPVIVINVLNQGETYAAPSASVGQFFARLPKRAVV